MARIIDNKFLFIHVAKTGGTFFREALNNFGIPNRETGDFSVEDHYSYAEVIKTHPELASLHSFGFVRHPVSWYRSRWAYAMMTHFEDKMKYLPEARAHWMAGVWSRNLNQFVENILERHPKGIASNYFHMMLGMGGLGPERVSSIHRYEDLDIILQRYLIKCKDDYVALEDIRKTGTPKSSKHLPDQIDDTLKREIEKAEKILLDLFY